MEFQVLSDAGIVPSNSATYSSSDIISAISNSFGQDPVILCDDSTLYQIYYGFFVTGSLTDENFVPAAIVGDSSNCPSSGIKYPVKSGATSVSATATATATTSASKTTTTAPATTATGSSVSGSGYFNAYYNSNQDGCLISGGSWYIGGTCATYHATATSSFTLLTMTTSISDANNVSGDGFTVYTSKGDCGVVDGVFGCGSSVSSSTFSIVNGLLAYDGQTTFYTTEVPSGSEQADVYTAEKTYSVTFEWAST